MILLIGGLQDALLSTGAISSRESKIRVPCMAHVIQLCLKQLLGHIRAAPENLEVGTSWSDSQVSFLKDSADRDDAAHTLAKGLALAIHVWATLKPPSRSGHWQSLLTLALNDGTRLLHSNPFKTNYSTSGRANALELNISNASPSAKPAELL
ncbi:hypothetical protein CNMCM8980_002379 [Aspergillus fumigatiaffinis]|nr:hypothetical protein CNMCM8980_002379 [Aspergillus fumigatiaffinis]